MKRLFNPIQVRGIPDMQQAPYPLAMVICDAIFRDPGSGKRTLLGCFSTIIAPKFPARQPLLALYIAVTDGRGRVPITLKLVDVDEDAPPIFEAENVIEFTDPRVIMELDLHIANAVFPKPGEYRLQLLAGKEPILERRILVLGLGEGKQDAGEEPRHD